MSSQEIWSKETVEELKQTEHESDSVRVYVAGPKFDYGGWERVRQAVKDQGARFAKLEVVDPLDRDIEEREEIPRADVDLLATCDVVLVYHVSGVESWGTPAEVYLAKLADYPVVLWEITAPTSKRSVWLESSIDWDCEVLNQALSACLTADQ